MRVLALVGFGGVVWACADAFDVPLPLHGLLWLCVLGSLPWLVQRPAARGLWVVVLLAALGAAVVGFGLNDSWLAVGGLLLMALLALRGLLVSYSAATLWGLSLMLQLLSTLEVIGEKPLSLATLAACSLLTIAPLHFGVQFAARRNWALPPRLLQSWTMLFTLLGAFVPLTLLLDPDAIHPALLATPLGLLALGLIVAKGWQRQRPFLQAGILWGAFVCTWLLPDNDSTLVWRAICIAIGGILAQATALHRSPPQQRNHVLLRMAFILVALLFGLQFRNLNIL